jgi:hypothetical protein
VAGAAGAPAVRIVPAEALGDVLGEVLGDGRGVAPAEALGEALGSGGRLPSGAAPAGVTWTPTTAGTVSSTRTRHRRSQAAGSHVRHPVCCTSDLSVAAVVRTD